MEDNALTQEVKPPDTSKGPVRWLRDNLFSTWYNTILTCLGLVFLFLFFKGFLTWVFTQANWRVIPANLQILMIGPFPIEQVWRIGIVFCTLLTLLGLSAGIWRGIVLQMTIAIAGVCLLLLLIPFDVVREAENTSATLEFNLNIFYLIFFNRIWLLGGLVLLVGTFFIGRKKDVLKKWIIGGWILSFPWTMIMLHGFGENTVSTTNWGGLLLTLILAAVGNRRMLPNRCTLGTWSKKSTASNKMGLHRLH